MEVKLGIELDLYLFDPWIYIYIYMYIYKVRFIESSVGFKEN